MRTLKYSRKLFHFLVAVNRNADEWNSKEQVIWKDIKVWKITIASSSSYLVVEPVFIFFYLLIFLFYKEDNAERKKEDEFINPTWLSSSLILSSYRGMVPFFFVILFVPSFTTFDWLPKPILSFVAASDVLGGYIWFLEYFSKFSTLYIPNRSFEWTGISSTISVLRGTRKKLLKNQSY